MWSTCSSSGSMAVASEPAGTDTPLIILHPGRPERGLEPGQSPPPGGVEVRAGREAVVELEDRHPVRERECGPGQVAITAHRFDHGRGRAVLAAGSQERAVKRGVVH